MTKEHIPPQKAFNNRTVMVYQGEEVLGIGPDGPVEGGKQQQGGFSKKTLCARCNNNTGSWYAADFITWCYQGMEILHKAEGSPTLHYPHSMFPLRILKQVVTMFASVNSPDMTERNPELRRFVLNKEARHLPRRFRFFVYFTTTGKARYVGISALTRMGRGQTHVLSEFCYPPYGYVMTFGSDPPDDRLCEITHFSHCGYKDFRVVSLQIPVLPVHLAYPGDYRRLDEIQEDYERNVAARNDNSDGEE